MIEKQIVFLLDETGSMADNAAEVVQAFNRYLADLRDRLLSDPSLPAVRFWLTLFNSAKTEARYEGVPLAEVADLTPETYQPDSLTPLWDAIMQTMKVVEGNAFMVILTDGLENASREYSLDAVKAGIAAKKALGWEFLFLASDLDVLREGVRTVGAAASTPTVSHSHALRTASLATDAYVAGHLVLPAQSYAADAAEQMGKEGTGA